MSEKRYVWRVVVVLLIATAVWSGLASRLV